MGTTHMSDETDARPLRELEALAGADYVREKLLSTLTIGPNDFSKRIYAIKCRIKSERRLADKVRNRRQKKPGYTALDATDIVGLRLVCIFSEELPAVVSSFLDYVEFMQDPRIGLFAGSGLPEAIAEIVVYAARNNSSVYTSIFDNLHSKFSAAIALGTLVCRLEQPTDQHPYSSIHIICRANSYYSEIPKTVAVEVQIRTAFEDIWSEIEHPRGYKGPDFADKYRADPVLHGIANNISRRLRGLKTSLEACALQAEDIGRDFNTLDQRPGVEEALVIAKQSNRRVIQERRLSGDAPSEIARSLAAIEDALGALYGRIASDKRVDTSAEIVEVAEGLHDGIRSLASLADRYESDAPEVFKADLDFAYYRHSEAGLAHYWIARLLKGFLEPGSAEALPDRGQISDIGGLNSDRHLERALGAYFTLQLDHDPIDALLSFRIANALALQGHEQLALDKCREAYAALEKDARLPAEDAFRAVIPRAYGYALWRFAMRLREHVRLGQRGSLDAKARDAIKLAIRISITARETFLPNLRTEDRTSEESRYQNNVLSFLSTYVELNGSLTDFGELGVREKVSADVEDLRAKAGTTASRLDTCVRAYVMLGDSDKARDCAEALAASLDRGDLARHYRAEDVSYMRETVRLGKGEVS